MIVAPICFHFAYQNISFSCACIYVSFTDLQLHVCTNFIELNAKSFSCTSKESNHIVFLGEFTSYISKNFNFMCILHGCNMHKSTVVGKNQLCDFHNSSNKLNPALYKVYQFTYFVFIFASCYLEIHSVNLHFNLSSMNLKFLVKIFVFLCILWLQQSFLYCCRFISTL